MKLEKKNTKQNIKRMELQKHQQMTKGVWNVVFFVGCFKSRKFG